MKYFVAILIALLSGVARAQDLRHFNPGIFGVSADKPVALLQPGTTGALDPTSILTDVKGGKFYAATLPYPKKMTLDQAGAFLNRLYMSSEMSNFAEDPMTGLWQVADRRFVRISMFCMSFTSHSSPLRT